MPARLLALTFGVVIAASGLAISQAKLEPRQAASSTREQDWRDDLAFFAREFPARQIDFAKLYPREMFTRELEAITQSIPTRSDAEIVLGLMRLVASAHVGHTRIQWPTDGPLAFHGLPLGLQWYDDGLAVTAATEPYRDALGLRVVSFGSMTPDEIQSAIAPYLSYEHDGWLRHQSQSLMLMEEMLRALSLVDSDGRVAITLAKPDGSRLTVRVAPMPLQDRPPLVTAIAAFGIPLGPARIQPARYYRYEILPGTKTLFIRYNVCADDPKQPFAEFVRDMFAAVDSNPADVDRVIIDLRKNGGGNSSVIGPLLQGLRARKALSSRGRLYTLVGPATFSSGLLAAVSLRADLKSIIIGETPGEMLNSYGEVRPLTLPHSRLQLVYSTRFFTLTKNAAGTFDPDVVVRTTIADWLAGRDPVLDAATIHKRLK